jgi:hypothetical protein
LRLRLVSFDFAGLDYDLGLLSDLCAGGGLSVAPEETESRADSIKSNCKRPAPPRDWSFRHSYFLGRPSRNASLGRSRWLSVHFIEER